MNDTILRKKFLILKAYLGQEKLLEIYKESQAKTREVKNYPQDNILPLCLSNGSSKTIWLA